MLRKRVPLHISFWLLYFSITFFNELFLTSGFINEITLAQLRETFLSEFLLLVMKIGITYCTLYYFLPRWLKSTHKISETLLFLLVVFAFIFIYRGVIQFVTWPYIVHYVPEISLQSQIARFFYSFLEIFQLLGISVAIKLLRLRLENAQLEKEYIKEKMSSELVRLKAQIHPHFLFNMLNNVFFMAKNNSSKITDVILKMSELLRFMLYESEKKLVTLESELKIIADYIQLQQLRFDDKIKMDTRIEVDAMQAPVPPLLIFPLIENSFKHGVGVKSDNSFIVFSVFLKNQQLEISTRNLVIHHSVKSPKGEGIGQVNIKKQLEILYKDHTFEYTEKNNEYHVYMRINLNSYVDFELHNY
jgi:two-component system LytT family sensor kinase